VRTQQAPADYETAVDQQADDVDYFRHVLRNLVTTGEDFVCMLHVHAQSRMQAAVAVSDPILAPENVNAVVSMSRCIRRNIALAVKLAKPARAEPARTPPENPHAAIRRRIIRAVDDAIGRNATGPRADSLHEDLRERPDAPECDDEIDNRTIEDVIADMCRVLGLANLPESHPHHPDRKRPTPADIATICARPAPIPSAIAAHPPDSTPTPARPGAPRWPP
jgi:hypothetical protein